MEVTSRGVNYTVRPSILAQQPTLYCSLHELVKLGNIKALEVLEARQLLFEVLREIEQLF